LKPVHYPYLFGISVVWYMAIASVLGFVTNFWIARKLGEPILRHLVDKQSISRVNKLVANYGRLSLLFSRVFLGGFNNVVSYAAGLTSMSFKDCFLISFFGIIPGTFVWFMLAKDADSPEEFTILSVGMSYIMFVFFASRLVVGKLKNGRFREKAGVG